MTIATFKIGIRALDALLGDILVPKTLIVISGDTGTGKTILASTICYSNALEGHRCLYISSLEDKVKMYEEMKTFGMDFEDLERKGLIRFYKLPIAVKRETLVNIAVNIHTLIKEYGPSVIIFDSFYPLMRLIYYQTSDRGVLEDLLNEILMEVDGLIIFTVGRNLKKECIEGIDIEFLADIILTLKREIKNNTLSRVIEIIKARNISANVAVIPFTIVKNKGILAHEPIILEKIPPLKPGKISIPCKILNEYIEHLHKGQVIYIAYPPDARPLQILLIIMGIVLVNGLRSMFISYRASPYEIIDLFKRQFRTIGLDPKLVDKVVEKYFILEGINPAIGIEQQYIWEIELIRTHKPDIVVFHGVDIVANMGDPYEYRTDLFNQILHFKKMGILVIRLGIYDEKWYPWNARISDVVIKFDLTKDQFGGPKYTIHIWRLGRDPIILDHRQFERCIQETGKIVGKILKEYA